MSGVLKIEITESENELRELAKKEQGPIVKERIQTLYWLKTNQVESVNHLAVVTGRHRTTVSRWLSAYRREGLKALLEVGKSSGRPNAIAPAIQEKIKEELRDPEGFRSYGEIQKWLEAVHDLKVSYTVVYKLVRYQLKAKLKVPRPVNIKQEEEAREAFKKTYQTI